MIALPWMPNEVRGRVLVGLLYANVLSSAVAFPQRFTHSFGPCADRVLGYVPAGLAVTTRPRGERALVSVLHKQDRVLSQYLRAESGTIDSVQSFVTAGFYTSLIPSGSRPDGDVEYVAFSGEGAEAALLTIHGPHLVERQLPFNVHARRCVVADVNNDGKMDILLCGKSMAGVATLLRKGATGFVTGPLLLPELSISDLAAADLNGDGITDLVLLNWLSNKMLVYFGISNGVFSEQVSVDLPGEPGELAISASVRQRSIRVAITLPDLKQVALMTGSPTGEFVLTQIIPCPGTPTGVQFARVNDDQLPDLVTMTDRGALVSLATQGMGFAPPIAFGFKAGPGAWRAADLDGDGLSDIVLIEPRSRRMVFVANANHTGNVRWPDQYAVGESPRGLLLMDANHDGALDIIVANSGSSTISTLLNKGQGVFAGQLAMVLGDQPATLTRVAGSPASTITLVASHPTSGKISVLKFNHEPSPVAAFSIPTSTNSHVLFSRENQRSGDLTILVRTSRRRETSLAFSLFEEISGGQFLERTLRATSPNRILALSGGSFAGDNTYQLALVSHDRPSRQSMLSLAEATGGFSFQSVTPVLSFMDSSACTRWLIAGDVDGDGNTDVLLVLGSPVNSFGIAYGRGDGSFRNPVEWIPDVDPLSDDSIIVRDVDGDGYTDMTFIDATQQTVVTLYGTGGGKFGPPRTICSASGLGGIAVGPLRSSGAQDLAVTLVEKGMVSIMFSPFSR